MSCCLQVTVGGADSAILSPCSIFPVDLELPYPPLFTESPCLTDLPTVIHPLLTPILLAPC